MLKVELTVFQTAAAGDTVLFAFTANNYTVTQSSFDAPCTPQAGGLDTGLCVLSTQKVLHTVVFLTLVRIA
jgi:hypothetical protein